MYDILSYNKRIHYLEKKYSETNIARGEKLSASTKKRINKNYNQNQQRRRVDAILSDVKKKESIKKEVHDIVQNAPLKELCKNCKDEPIITILILYVQTTRNPHYRIDRTALWQKYEVTWLKYSLIIERLLQWTREQKTFIKTDKKVDNEQLICW